MKATTRIENFKDFNPELTKIDFLESLHDEKIEISIKNLFSTSANLSKNGNKISIDIFNCEFLVKNSDENFSNVHAFIEDNELFFDSFFVDNTHTKIDEEGILREVQCSTNIIRTKKFNKGILSHFKCFIPIDHSNYSNFHNHFETVTYQDNSCDYFYDCIRFKLGMNVFDITQIKHTNKYYFIIENLKELTFTKFQSICFSIRQAIGFITGYMPGGEEYYFTENLDFFYINSLRPAIDSMFCPIHQNPYSFLHTRKEIAEKYLNKLTLLSSKNLSKLIREINKNPEFSSVIILLLEASSIHSLLIIPSVFAVIIESLSKIVSKKEMGLSVPITDKPLSNTLKKDLNKILESYSTKISKESFIKLKRRINEINRPINKERLTNNEKLILPFQQLKIDLTYEDIEVIEHRNDLLHGNILLKNEKIRIKDIDSYMGYVSAKLYTLISALVLKYIGYNGYIINYSKFYEENCQIKTEEEFYRLI